MSDMKDIDFPMQDLMKELEPHIKEGAHTDNGQHYNHVWNKTYNFVRKMVDRELVIGGFVMEEDFENEQ